MLSVGLWTDWVKNFTGRLQIELNLQTQLFELPAFMESYIIQKALDSLHDLFRELPLSERLERCRANFTMVATSQYFATSPPEVRKAFNEYLSSIDVDAEDVFLRGLIIKILQASGKPDNS